MKIFFMLSLLFSLNTAYSSSFNESNNRSLEEENKQNLSKKDAIKIDASYRIRQINNNNLSKTNQSLIIKQIQQIEDISKIDSVVIVTGPLCIDQITSKEEYLIIDENVGKRVLPMDWERIRFLMYMGSKTPEPKMAETQTILEIMGSPITDKEKLNKIKSIDGGNAYTELVNKYGSYLRMGVVNYYYNIEQTKESQIEKPLFAIKSNILFDIATLINVEIEVPISKRISVAEETMFPQWNLKKQQKTIEAITGNL